MAKPEPPNTYFIPPPPLPEFYLPKAAGDDDGSLTSADSDVDSQALVKARAKGTLSAIQSERQRSKAGLENNFVNSIPHTALPNVSATKDEEKMMVKGAIMAQGAYFPVMSALPPPPLDSTCDVSPLAIFHICRICLRTRSSRYHTAHPIPINGLPPPPGICRRCRVTTVDERKLAKVEVVERGESNEVTLGIGCILAHDDYVTNEEMRERRRHELLRSIQRRDVKEESSSSSSVSEERKIMYRHVRAPERQQTSELRAALGTDAVTAGDLHKTTDLRIRSAKTSASTRVFNPSVHSASKVSTISTSTKGAPLAHTTSEIHAIAREEIEHYRQAERMLEAHPEAFSHGRMVPVERRISAVKDPEPAAPWTQKAKTDDRKTLEEVDGRMSTAQKVRSDVDDEHGKPSSEVGGQRMQELSEKVESPHRSSPAKRSQDNPGRPDWASDAELQPQVASVDPHIGKESRSTRITTTTKRAWGPKWLQELPAEPSASREDTHNADSVETQLRSGESERRFGADEDKYSPPSPNRMSDARVSVRLKEVSGRYQSEGPLRVIPAKKSTRPKQTRPPEYQRFDEIEVIEEYEIPKSKGRPNLRGGDTAASEKGSGLTESVGERLYEIERIERRGGSAATSNPREKSKPSSIRTDREYWINEDEAGKVGDYLASRSEPSVHRHCQQQREDWAHSVSSLSDRMLDSPTRWGDDNRRTIVLSEHGMSATQAPSHAPGCVSPRPDYWQERSKRESEYRQASGSARSQNSAKLQHEKYNNAEGTSQLGTEKQPGSAGSQRTSRTADSVQRPAQQVEASRRGSAKSHQSERSPDSRYSHKVGASLSALDPKANSSRSHASERSLDREYIYAERKVQPADFPASEAAPGTYRPKHRVEYEEFTRRRRTPRSRTDASVPPLQQHQARTEAKVGDSNHSSQAKASTSNHSSRVRFASKVEISPTPPGSDASSHQFRSFAGRGVRHAKAFDEHAEDLFAEYERRGRSRSRDPPRMQEGDYQLELKEEINEWERSETPKPGSGYGREQKGTGSTSRHDGRPKIPRPLQHALSESPSRESLGADLRESMKKNVDGAGPFRPERPRAESLDVEDGSARVRLDKSSVADQKPAGDTMW